MLMYTESKGTLSLLLIEDDSGLRSLFASLLTEAGYTYTFAWSLEEARHLADEHTFALVMADLFLDGALILMQHLRDFCALIHDVFGRGYPRCFRRGRKRPLLSLDILERMYYTATVQWALLIGVAWTPQA